MTSKRRYAKNVTPILIFPHQGGRDLARLLLVLAALPLLALLATCGPSDAPATPAAPTQAAPAAATPTPDAVGLRLLLASTDLSVGDNRVVFALIASGSGPVRQPDGVRIQTFYLAPTGQEGPIETIAATYREWGDTGRGAYTVRLNFDRAGDWGLGVSVQRPDGALSSASARVPVRERSLTPALGAPAPLTASKTLADTPEMSELTSDPQPDSELYTMTIADAVASGQPLVVVFSTPAYCTTATCGPQLDVLKQARDRHPGRANFIHVEVYDNPHEIEGDLSNARIAPAVTEWGLPSEPWTFVVGGDGLVAAKFEGFATLDELEQALQAVLGP